MHRIPSLICLSLCMIAPLSADIQTDLKELDQEIQALEQRDKVLQARIRYQSSEAERLLFEDWTDYRSHMRAAEQAQQEAKLVEMNIDALKQKRAELQKQVR